MDIEEQGRRAMVGPGPGPMFLLQLPGITKAAVGCWMEERRGK